jgi:hypothetical protein
MISQSYYDEIIEENEKLLKKNAELLKENEKLKSENKKLKEDLNNYSSSSSFMKNIKNESISYHINGEICSISFSPEDISIENKEEILPFSENDSHFICRECHKVPIIEFNKFKNSSINSNSSISIKDSIFFNSSCSCFLGRNISLNDIIKEYIVRENEENGNDNIESYLKCEQHNEKFNYYCKYDNAHLCTTCLKQNYYHQIHALYFFDLYYFNINKKKDSIFKILNDKAKEMNLEFNDAELLLNLFSVIFNDFKSYPNYSHFLIIEKALTFLEHFISNKNNEEIIESLEFQKRLIINDKKILYQNMKNPEIIKEIDIENSNISDITQLCELNFVNLERLYLSENSISNLEPLRRAKFKNIKCLGFGRNKIGNENIPYLLEMKFDQLEELNLYSNNLTDCKIFNLQNNHNLPNLKIFYLGNNRINWNKSTDKKDITDVNIKYNFKNLITIGLTGGIFNEKTIGNISSFDFSNLKIIYLSRCDIKSLKFVDNLELPCVKEFYLNISFINEFYPLIKYNNLEIINMRNNSIKSIDTLKAFIEKLPKLKVFNIKGNDIKKNVEENEEEIIKSIKNIRSNLDITI